MGASDLPEGQEGKVSVLTSTAEQDKHPFTADEIPPARLLKGDTFPQAASAEGVSNTESHQCCVVCPLR